MSSLYDLANRFKIVSLRPPSNTKIAANDDSSSDADTGIDGVRSNETILQDMVDLPDFEDRVGHAAKVKHWKKLGEGSSRTIFQISDSLVLKIAHNDKGLEQNLAEMSMQGEWLNNVLAADSEGRWVIIRFTETMKEEDFKDYFGFGFKPFGKSLGWSFNNEQHEDKPKDYDEIVESSVYKCLAKLTLKHQLQLGDCVKISSWGLLDGRPVLRDFGLTKDIYKEHYKSDSSSAASVSKVEGKPSSSSS